MQNVKYPIYISPQHKFKSSY